MAFQPVVAGSASQQSASDPTFDSLQLSQEAWDRYRNENVPDQDYSKLGIEGEVTQFETVGYGKHAQKILQAAKKSIPDEAGDEEDVVRFHCLFSLQNGGFTKAANLRLRVSHTF